MISEIARCSPCKECKERGKACHATCERYKEYKEQLETTRQALITYNKAHESYSKIIDGRTTFEFRCRKKKRK